MSRSKRHAPQSRTDAVTTAEPKGATSPGPREGFSAEAAPVCDRKQALPWVLGAMGLAVLWWVALGIMAVTTANPPLVNRAQILESNYVVVGRVTDVAAGRVAVVEEMAHGDELGEIVVAGLKEADYRHFRRLPIEAGEAYLLPLSVDEQGRYFITPLPASGARPPMRLIYAAIPETLAQAREILDDRGGRR